MSRRRGVSYSLGRRADRRDVSTVAHRVLARRDDSAFNTGGARTRGPRGLALYEPGTSARSAASLLEAIDRLRVGARHRLEEVAAGRADPAVGVHEDADAHHGGDLLGAGEVARHVGPDLPRDERHDAAIGRGLAERDAHHA